VPVTGSNGRSSNRRSGPTRSTTLPCMNLLVYILFDGIALVCADIRLRCPVWTLRLLFFRCCLLMFGHRIHRIVL